MLAFRSLASYLGALAAAMVSAHLAHAQSQSIVIGGADVTEDRGLSACARDFGKDSTAAWFERLIHPLCQRGDADSLLAVYLFSMPGLGSSNGKFDTRDLKRAYARGKSNAKLLWVVTTQTDCA